MKWVVSIQHGPDGHGHIETPTPEGAAIALNEINDEFARGGRKPARAHITEVTGEVYCPTCGAVFRGVDTTTTA